MKDAILNRAAAVLFTGKVTFELRLEGDKLAIHVDIWEWGIQREGRPVQRPWSRSPLGMLTKNSKEAVQLE